MIKIIKMVVAATATVCFIVTSACSEGEDPGPSEKTQGNQSSGNQTEKDKTPAPDSQSGTPPPTEQAAPSAPKKDEQRSETNSPANTSPDLNPPREKVPNPDSQATAPPQQPEAVAPPPVPPQSASVDTPPVITATPPKKVVLSDVIVGDEDVSKLLLELISLNENNESVENARNRLVDEVLSNEDEAPGKILEIQASVAKISRAGLYTPEVKHRVAFLQTGIVDRVHAENYYDVLQKGIFFVGTGLVLGTLSGTGVFNYLPRIGPGLKTGYLKTQSAVRENVSAVYARTVNGVMHTKSFVSDKEQWADLGRKTIGGVQSLKRSTVNAGSRIKSDLVNIANKSLRPVERVVFDNLEDLGVVGAERSAIETLEPVETAVLPAGIQFISTPKSSFKFAALGKWEGRELGIERVLVFKQRRIIRGFPFETTFVTNPMPADVAGKIASHISERASDGIGQRFVHFKNLKTGAISAMRWRAGNFQNMMASAGQKIKPLFGRIDIPTAVGTGVVTTGAMILGYNYGYEQGQSALDESDNLNLEAMLPPQNNLDGDDFDK